MSNIRNNYLRVLEVISSFSIESHSKSQAGRKCMMYDIEVDALSLTVEFM